MKQIKLFPKEAEVIVKDLKKILTVKGHKLAFKSNLIISQITKVFVDNQKAFETAKQEFFIQDEKGKPKVFEEDGNQIFKIQEGKIEEFNQLAEDYLSTEMEISITPFKKELLQEELDNERFADVELVGLFLNMKKICE